MSALDELLAPFLTQATPDAGEERPFAFEPFTMPVRAFATSLAGYEAEINYLEAMDAPPTPPEFLDSLPPAGHSFIDTLSLAEGGANASTQLAGLLHGLKEINGTHVYWLVGLGSNFWLDMALVRAGKALVYKHFNQKSIEVFVLHILAAGRRADMTEADGYTNLLRLTTHALTAHAAGADALYLPEFAASAPGHEDLRQRIHQVVEHESRVHNYGPAQQGAYWPTLLAVKLMQEAEGLAEQDLQVLAAETLSARRTAVAEGKQVWVGQTKFANPGLTIAGPAPVGKPEWA